MVWILSRQCRVWHMREQSLSATVAVCYMKPRQQQCSFSICNYIFIAHESLGMPALPTFNVVMGVNIKSMKVSYKDWISQFERRDGSIQAAQHFECRLTHCYFWLCPLYINPFQKKIWPENPRALGRNKTNPFLRYWVFKKAWLFSRKPKSF